MVRDPPKPGAETSENAESADAPDRDSELRPVSKLSTEVMRAIVRNIAERDALPDFKVTLLNDSNVVIFDRRPSVVH